MRRAVTIGVLACTALALGAGQAAASSVYNDTELSDTGNKPPAIRLVCGIFCGTDYNVQPGQFASRPGKETQFWNDFAPANFTKFSNLPSPANWPNPNKDEPCEIPSSQDFDLNPDPHPKTTDHGWAELHYNEGVTTNSAYSWSMFDNDGNVYEKAPYTIVLGYITTAPSGGNQCSPPPKSSGS